MPLKICPWNIKNKPLEGRARDNGVRGEMRKIEPESKMGTYSTTKSEKPHNACPTIF